MPVKISLTCTIPGEEEEEVPAPVVLIRVFETIRLRGIKRIGWWEMCDGDKLFIMEKDHKQIRNISSKSKTSKKIQDIQC